jgi:hypothetical protein
MHSCDKVEMLQGAFFSGIYKKSNWVVHDRHNLSRRKSIKINYTNNFIRNKTHAHTCLVYYLHLHLDIKDNFKQNKIVDRLSILVFIFSQSVIYTRKHYDH